MNQHPPVPHEGLSEPAPSPVLDGGQFIHQLWVGQPPPTVLLWAGFKNNIPFFYFFFSPKPVLQTYHPPPILGPATPIPLPAFLVGATLYYQVSPGATHITPSSTPSPMFPGILCTLLSFVSFFIF